MTKEQPSYYAIIPANVRYSTDLKANEKLMYGEITCLAHSTGNCYASNQYFADLYGVSKETVSRWISNLKSLGFIKVKMIYRDGTKEIINRYIQINQYPINENINTPIDENINTPIDENIKGNTTSINNTRINKDLLSSKPDISNNQVSNKKTNKKDLDYSSWPELPDQQILDDWLELRKRMRAPVSQTVINRFGKELHNAVRQGYSVDACLTEVVTRGWRGFEAQWLVNSDMRNQTNYPNQPQQSSAGGFINKHTDTSWAE